MSLISLYIFIFNSLYSIHLFITLLAPALDLSSNESVITLHCTTALGSRVKEVLLYCSCSHTTTSQTRRCKCFKSGAKCTNYFLKRKNELDDQAGSCLNLAAPEARNIRTLISLGIPPTYSTSPLSLSQRSLSPLSLSPVSTPLPSASSSTIASPTS